MAWFAKRTLNLIYKIVGILQILLDFAIIVFKLILKTRSYFFYNRGVSITIVKSKKPAEIVFNNEAVK
jgi:hypothetical protein